MLTFRNLSGGTVFSLGEGFARAVAEAMVVGLPCILPGTPELATVYGSAADFVPPDYYESFSKKIVDLLKDQSKLNSEQKSLTLANNFGWESVSKRVFYAIRSSKVSPKLIDKKARMRSDELANIQC